MFKVSLGSNRSPSLSESGFQLGLQTEIGYELGFEGGDVLREKRPDCTICVLGGRIGGMCMRRSSLHVVALATYGGTMFQGGDTEGSGPQVFKGNLAD